jgi:hypothetical protein
MRGNNANGDSKVIHLSGLADGEGYTLANFEIFPTTGVGTTEGELMACLTRDTTASDPANPDFDEQGLIGNVTLRITTSTTVYGMMLINSNAILTQDLLLTVKDENAAHNNVNWQLTFNRVAISGSREAVANFEAFSIRNDNF